MFASSRFRGLFIFSVYFCVIFSQWSRAATNYCAIPSCGTGRHTRCLYQNNTPSSRCTKYVSAYLTENEKAAVVKRHNELRKKVTLGLETRGNPGGQPPASDMKIMRWDEELAQIAQRWVDQCITGHDECRNSGRLKIKFLWMYNSLGPERFSVGQNIVTYWNTGTINKTMEQLHEIWYNEVTLFSKDQVSQYQFVAATAHYTQLIWAETSLVGCARARYFDTGRNMNTERFICNYGPAGNRIGRPIYKIGQPGTACPLGVSSVDPSLCN